MSMRMPRSAVLAIGLLVGSACGAGGDGGAVDGAAASDRPLVVATTSILGDVVANLVGDGVEVATIMQPGADPHDFQPSAQQADRIRRADVLVVNGGGFEAGLQDVIAAAEADGVPVYEAISAVTTLPRDDHDDHDDHDAEHADDEGGAAHPDEAEPGGGAVDPHFFADPARMAQAAQGLGDHLAAAVEGLDPDAVEQATTAYVERLQALDREVESTLAAIPPESRVLVTNHEVFAYFADRYGFEVVGAVIPSGTTGDAASAAALAELAEVIRQAGAPAIFVDSSAADDLARTVADEAGGAEVVPLFTESLGAPGSGGEHYVDMIRTNAQRIAGALA